MKSQVKKYICITIVITALFTIAKCGNNTVLTDGWINEMLSVYVCVQIDYNYYINYYIAV